MPGGFSEPGLELRPQWIGIICYIRIASNLTDELCEDKIQPR